jgi:hypothetical protein
MIGAACDLLMTCFQQSALHDSENGDIDELREFSLSPATEAARTMKGIMCKFPRFFANDEFLVSLTSKFRVPMSISKKTCTHM